MDGCFISSFYFRLPFTALPFSCAYPHTLPKSHFFFSSKCPLLSPFIAISLLHSFPPNQVLTSFSVSFIITPLSLSLASPFLFAIRISFLLPVLPLVFLSLSSPFCLFLISHSQVLPDSFTHSFLFSFRIASFPFQLPYFFTLLVILTFLFSSSWIAFPCVSYLLTHFLTSSSLFVILYFVSFFVFLSLHFLLRLWTQNSYWKGFVFFQLLIKRRFNTIKCHLLPVGTQQ